MNKKGNIGHCALGLCPRVDNTPAFWLQLSGVCTATRPFLLPWGGHSWDSWHTVARGTLHAIQMLRSAVKAIEGRKNGGMFEVYEHDSH